MAFLFYAFLNTILSLVLLRMAEKLVVNNTSSKAEAYLSLLPQIKALIGDETDLIANMANVSAALKSTFNWWWVGFYLVKDNQLVLGPFQGPIACTRIDYGKGVCGTSWLQQKTIIVPDVHKFPGHIACSAESNSEIVVPVWNQSQQMIAVLDCDSEFFNQYDETDQQYLEEICKLLA